MTALGLLDQYRSSISTAAIIDDHHRETVEDPHVRTVDDACRKFFTSTPGWLQTVMRIRNTLVRRLGFAAGDGTAPVLPDVIEAGQQFSVFGVLDRSEHEILLGGDDTHFSMRISIALVGGGREDPNDTDPTVHLATVAHHHDALGRAYLTLVKLGHGPIAAMTARRIAAA